MLWSLYALICAFSLATTDALSKRILERTGTILVAWGRLVFSIPFLLLLLPFIRIPSLPPLFFWILLILAPLELTSILLYTRAIKVSPLSLTIPFLALTPVFLIFTSFVILKETPSTSGILGILLVTTGAYLLNIDTKRSGILEPFRAITREKGSVMMIIVAFIFSISANLGKVAIAHSSPSFFAIFYPPYISLFLTIILITRYRGKTLGLLRERWLSFVPIGLFSAMMIIFHNLSIARVEVAYMISIKRMSLLFSVIYGALIFKETKIKERLSGTLTMLIGAAVITIFA
jgi:drug/metabolite transporter (DMT)-like permease